MSTATGSTEATNPNPAIIVFGKDGAGKAHASWFEEHEAVLATKAAGLMGMRVLALTSDEHRDLVAGVPRGRVFGSGRAFVPFSKSALYAKLNALVPAEAGMNGGDAGPEQQDATSEAHGAAGPNTGEPAHRPSDWVEIQAGSLVLMSEGVGHGWYAGVVTEAKPDDLFVLRWRDWPEERHLVRRREHLALLHPSFEYDEVGA